MTIFIGRDSISDGQFELKPLDRNNKIVEGFSSDSDLDEFFREDCWKYEDDLFAKTYKLIAKDDENDILALVSLSNDALAFETKSRVKKEIPYHKRFLDSFPAVKIGRLAVCQKHTKKGIGTYLLNFLKEMFLTQNRTGCRFITVDSYRDSVGFYEKCGFIKNSSTTDDISSRTVSMYYNLKNFKDKVPGSD